MRSREFLWAVMLLVVIAVSVQLLPRHPLTPVSADTILGIQGVCLGDSRERVLSVLGGPAYAEELPDGASLLYGLHDPHRWDDTTIQLNKEPRVIEVTGLQLTDSSGSVICSKGTLESDLRRLLGRKADWVADRSGSDNIFTEDHHFKNWRLVVSVDRKTRRTMEFTLKEKFPAEPRGELNTKK